MSQDNVIAFNKPDQIEVELSRFCGRLMVCDICRRIDSPIVLQG